MVCRCDDDVKVVVVVVLVGAVIVGVEVVGAEVIGVEVVGAVLFIDDAFASELAAVGWDGA